MVGFAAVSASKTLLSAFGILTAGCVHSAPALHGPEDVARSYARALQDGKIDEAWALSAPLDREQFNARYADASVRQARALALEQAAAGQPTAQVALEVKAQGWRVIEQPTPVAAAADEQLARERVEHFLAAVDGGDFDAVFADLSASWRARYTPARLKSDFTSEPAAQARLARIRAALSGKWQVTLAGPQLPLGEGKTLKLLREGDALKVAAIE